jgi:flagellar biosynthesis protein FliR
MTLTPDQLIGFVNMVFWPFVRITALLMASPLFGARTFPVRQRIILGMLVAILISPLLPAVPAIQAFSVEGMLITAQQVVIGVAMGFILQMVFGALVVGGQAIATSMGLGFAATIDPQNGVQVPVISQFFLILATLVFLALNGHLVLIETIVESFYLWPIGSGPLPENLAMHTVTWIAEVFKGALLIALPAVAAILLVNLAFGVMTRAAPQINIFAVGFPITIIAGFIMIMLSLPVFLPQFAALLEAGFLQMLVILE